MCLAIVHNTVWWGICHRHALCVRARGGGGGVGLGWAGGLMQEKALGCGLPSLPHHEAELPDCPVPTPSGLSTTTRPHRSAGGRKIPSSCVQARARAGVWAGLQGAGCEGHGALAAHST